MYFKQIVEERLLKTIVEIVRLTGGDINEVYKITTEQNFYALKVNRIDLFPKMFDKEKLGLEMLAKTGVGSPKVIHCFSDKEQQYLLLEFIKEEQITGHFWKNFSENLVRLHQTSCESFGLNCDNYIGSLNQSNKTKNSWESFFIDCRIAPMLKQAFDNSLLNTNHLNAFNNLFNRLNEMLPIEKPALLHGDLWAGNLMHGLNQSPVFIDPAVYYGHREMDLAMTQMFGGFDEVYLDYYNEIFPLEKNWESRIEIHNLYPKLVHLNLFGLSYLRGIESVINKF